MQHLHGRRVITGAEIRRHLVDAGSELDSQPGCRPVERVATTHRRLLPRSVLLRTQPGEQVVRLLLRAIGQVEQQLHRLRNVPPGFVAGTS